MEYPWYEIIAQTDELQQGDFIPECPILIPPNNLNVGETPEIEINLIDSIVLSQSCDLTNHKIDIVLVCPYYPLKKFIEGLPPDQQSNKAIRKKIDDLRKGHLAGYHLLNKGFKFDVFSDYQVVDFKNVYGIQYDSLVNLIKNQEERIRLLPPYREHLSQAFARYFMRVGLPQDIEVEGY